MRKLSNEAPELKNEFQILKNKLTRKQTLRDLKFINPKKGAKQKERRWSLDQSDAILGSALKKVKSEPKFENPSGSKSREVGGSIFEAHRSTKKAPKNNQREIFRLNNNVSVQNDISEYLGSLYQEHFVNLDSIALGEAVNNPNRGQTLHLDSFKTTSMNPLSFKQNFDQPNADYFSYRNQTLTHVEEPQMSPVSSAKKLNMGKFKPKITNTTSLNFDQGISYLVNREANKKSRFAKSNRAANNFQFGQFSLTDSDYEQGVLSSTGAKTFDFFKTDETDLSQTLKTNDNADVLFSNLESGSSLKRSKGASKGESNLQQLVDTLSDFSDEQPDLSSGIRDLVQSNFSDLKKTIINNLKVPGVILNSKHDVNFLNKSVGSKAAKSKSPKNKKTPLGRLNISSNSLEIIKEVSFLQSIKEDSRIISLNSEPSSFLKLRYDYEELKEEELRELEQTIEAYYSGLKQNLYKKITRDPFGTGSTATFNNVQSTSEFSVSDKNLKSQKPSIHAKAFKNSPNIFSKNEKSVDEHLGQIFLSQPATPKISRTKKLHRNTSKKEESRLLESFAKVNVIMSEVINNESLVRNKHFENIPRSSTFDSSKEGNSKGLKKQANIFDSENWNHANLVNLKSYEVEDSTKELLSEKSIKNKKGESKEAVKKTPVINKKKVIYFSKLSPNESLVGGFNNENFNSRETNKKKRSNLFGTPNTEKTIKKNALEFLKGSSENKKERYLVSGLTNLNSSNDRLPQKIESQKKKNIKNEAKNKLEEPKTKNNHKSTQSYQYFSNDNSFIRGQAREKSADYSSSNRGSVVKFVNAFDIQKDGRTLINLDNFNEAKKVKLVPQRMSSQVSNPQAKYKNQRKKNRNEDLKKVNYVKSRERKPRELKSHPATSKPKASKVIRRVDYFYQSPRPKSKTNFIEKNKKMIRELSESRRIIRKSLSPNNKFHVREQSLLCFKNHKNYKDIYIERQRQKTNPYYSPIGTKNKKILFDKNPGARIPKNTFRFKYKKKIFRREIDLISENINKSRIKKKTN